MQNRLLVIPFTLVLLLCATIVFAADTQTIVTEGTYIMGDGETPSVAEQRACENARRAAVEQAGVYVESYSQTRNMQLTKDEVQVISSGLVQTTLVDQKRSFEGKNAIKFWCKVQCVIQLDSVEAMKGRLGDRQLIQQNKELQAKAAQLDNENAKLKAQLLQAQNEQAKKQTEQALTRNEQQFAVEQLVQKAYDFNVAGDYESARKAATQALVLDNHNEEAYFQRGNAYANGKQYEAAISDFSQAIKLNPEYADAYYERGRNYLSFALVVFQQLKSEILASLSIDDGDPVVVSQVDMSRAKNGASYIENLAIADFTTSLSIRPDYYCYYERAHLYAGNGKNDAAISDYTQMIKMKPNDGFAYGQRGKLFFYSTNNYQKAIDDFSRYIALNSDLPLSHFTVEYYTLRAEAYRKDKQNQRAISDCAFVIDLRTDERWLNLYKRPMYILRADIYRDMNNLGQSLSDYTSAIKLVDSYSGVEAYRGRAQTYILLDEYQLAVNDYSSAIEKEPDDAKTYYLRGKTYFKMGKRSLAAADFSTVKKLSPALYMQLSKDEQKI